MRIDKPEIVKGLAFVKDMNWFFEWFDEVVEPVNRILESGVEVYGSEGGSWGKVQSCVDIHKALLINIQKIKEDTAEDVLRGMIQDIRDNTNLVFKEEWLDRAKAVLGEL